MYWCRERERERQCIGAERERQCIGAEREGQCIGAERGSVLVQNYTIYLSKS